MLQSMPPWLILWCALGQPPAASTTSPEEAAAKSPPAVRATTAEKADRPWHTNLEAAIDDARKTKRPILFVAHATWCGPCRMLEQEFHKPEVQTALAPWVLVRLDVDQEPEVMERFLVSSIPAMRILDASGQVQRSNTGYMPAEELLGWLAGNDAAKTPDLKNRPEIADVTAATVPQLVELLATRDATRRELAMRRLETSPDLSRLAVAESLVEGNLSTRLAALDILAAWRAPVGELDPWRPETLSRERLKAIEKWAEDHPAAPAAARFTDAELAAAREEIRHVLTVDTSDLDALGARLARYGTELLPAVHDLRAKAESDRDRERLDWFRYRLTASDQLAVKWSDGLVRLATANAATRQQAAGELSSVVTSGDELLLVELLAHPDAFVREMSLKSLNEIGTSAAGEKLTALLADPDPNVRVAVLKQLTEQPSPKVVPSIAAYVAKEKDPALVSQAVRLLRAIHGRKAVECLITLFAHENWQVRAEAVEAVGECLSQRASHSFSADTKADDELRADGYTAILEVLRDTDGFVVSRAVLALKEADLPIAAAPLAKTAERFPEFAGVVAEALVSGENVRAKATPELRKWLAHGNENLRAAAIKALGGNLELDGEAELVPALSDPHEMVRIAAAGQVLFLCRNQREPVDVANSVGVEVNGAASTIFIQAADALFGGLFNRGAAPVLESPPPAEVLPPSPVTAPPGEKPDSDQGTAPPADAAVGPYEAWLTAFRAGQMRPEWMNATIDPLNKMLESASEAERRAAAIPLIALGVDDKALSLLRQLTAKTPSTMSAAATVLPWLPWEQRRELFGEFRALATNDHQLAELCTHLVELRDPRASGLLWDVLGGDSIKSEVANVVVHLLQSNHDMESYGYYGDGAPPPPKNLDFAMVQNLAATGTVWQRRAALALLHVVGDEPAHEAAAVILKDAAADVSLRADAFAVTLLTSPPKEAQEEAARVLEEGVEVLAPTAAAFLSRGRQSISLLADGQMHLPGRRGSSSYSSDSEDHPLPDSLTIEQLQPLRAGANHDAAADAAYLASMLGDNSAIDAVIARWRKAGKGYAAQPWEKLVYRAIAAGDDPQHVPVLAEIYAAMATDRQYSIKDLYWTIRSMHGPEILALRKRIRDEIGMDQLR